MDRTFRLMLAIAALVVAVDQALKYLVATALPLGGAWPPFAGQYPIFQIVHVANTGVAFGLFKDAGPLFIIIRLVVSVVIVVYARRLREDQRLGAVALGLMLGGAIGNVSDGLRLGYVIDFFDVGLGAVRNASNLADWSIVLGGILFGLAMLREERRLKNDSGASTQTSSVEVK